MCCVVDLMFSVVLVFLFKNALNICDSGKSPVVLYISLNERRIETDFQVKSSSYHNSKPW